MYVLLLVNTFVKMNYTLQLHSSNRTYPVPRGLHDLMSDIAREVLRNKPQKIENFIYNYLDSLLKIRKVGKGVAIEVDKTITAGVKKKMMFDKLRASQQEVEKAAAKMQAAFRGHQKRKEFRESLKIKGKEAVSRLEADHLTSDILKKYKLTAAQANSVCTKIQAAFRGWRVRNKKLQEVPSHESWRHDWLWKEFQMSPEEVQAVTHAEKKQQPKEKLLFEPRRSIEIDHIKFMKAFKGELADYDDQSDSSSMEDISPSEEESETKMRKSKSLEARTGEHQDTDQETISSVSIGKIVKKKHEREGHEIDDKEGKEYEMAVHAEKEEISEKEEVTEKEEVPDMMEVSEKDEVSEKESGEQKEPTTDDQDTSQEPVPEQQLISELDELTEEDTSQEPVPEQQLISELDELTEEDTSQEPVAEQQLTSELDELTEEDTSQVPLPEQQLTSELHELTEEEDTSKEPVPEQQLISGLDELTEEELLQERFEAEEGFYSDEKPELIE